MTDPWKVTTCREEICLADSMNDDAAIKKEFKLYPVADSPEEVVFVCPICEKTQVWEAQQQSVMKTLYERYGK